MCALYLLLSDNQKQPLIDRSSLLTIMGNCNIITSSLQNLRSMDRVKLDLEMLCNPRGTATGFRHNSRIFLSHMVESFKLRKSRNADDTS